MQACRMCGVKHVNQQDVWCVAKSASWTSGVKLAERAAQSCLLCSPAIPAHAHLSFVMRDPRVLVLVKLPEVTGHNESMRACNGTKRQLHRAYALTMRTSGLALRILL